VIATGHYLGDTGNYGNTLYTGIPSAVLKGSTTPFIENDEVLGELNAHFDGNYLSETSLLAAARAAGYATAVVGKTGPAAIQDLTGMTDPQTIVIDDAAGGGHGVPLTPEIADAIRALGLSPSVPKTSVPNIEQQAWLSTVATKIVLPKLAKNEKGFVLVFWSRDPDASQHGTTDSIGMLNPGINGPSAKAGVRNADNMLKALRQTLATLGVDKDTDIFVTADHGFSTVAKNSKTSAASKFPYRGAIAGEVPSGFLAIDLADALGVPLYDTTSKDLVDYKAGKIPSFGNGYVGSVDKPEIVVAANGGSGFIYLNGDKRRDNAERIVSILTKQDYTGGLFVDDALGDIPGTLPLSAINLSGAGKTPVPAIIVGYRSFVRPGCVPTLLCAAEISDTSLKMGQGMHGTFSRADTRNFMAAFGPGLRKQRVSQVPISNADIAPTLAKLLGISLPSKGSLNGRVIEEALDDGHTPRFRSLRRASRPAPNGFRTVLVYKTVGGTRYFDAGGMPGRIVGLPAK
jgi:arylsulfatase A-like enzyme